MEDSFNKVVDLLFLAKRDGVEVIFDDERLQLKIEKDKDIDENLLKEIRDNKQSIIDYLTSNDWKAKSLNGNRNKIGLFDRASVTRIPLSFSQERLWFIDQLEGSIQYHTPAVLRLKGKLDENALLFSLQAIIDRHEVLRTVFHENGGRVYQSVKENESWQLQFVDGSIYKVDSDALKTYIEQLVEQPFDLSKDFPVRGSLIRLNDQEYVLVVTIHHIASDAWSVSIIVKELIELYNSFVEGRRPSLAPLPLQYADFAVWQRNYLQGIVLDEKISYWKQKLEGLEVLHLPTDYIRPSIKGTRGGAARFSVSRELSGQLQVLSQHNGSSLFMVLLSVLKVLLYRYSGQRDITVGTSIASRPQKELEGMIGFFVNTLALRDEVNAGGSFLELLQLVRSTLLEAYEHQELPFEKVVEAVLKERDAAGTPLFRVMLVLGNTPESAKLQLGDVELSGESTSTNVAKFDITFFITETVEGLQGLVQYSTDLYEEDTIRRMTDHFGMLLRSVVKDPHQKVGLLSMISEAEQRQLLEGSNVGEVSYPFDKSVVALFEEQVIRTPFQTALVFEGQSLTYGELNERSNQLAHYLRGRGVQPGSLIPLYVERSVAMMTGMLGIMKAGAVYVPIDTDFPAGRISYMIRDTGAAIIVSSAASSAGLEVEAGVEIVKVDSDISGQPTGNVPEKPLPGHLAYVIYTSGSTGTPKGVMIEHRSLVDYYYGLNKYTAIGESRSFALVSTIATDLGNTVIYASLLSGGALHIFSKESVSNIEYLGSYFTSNRIDCLKIVPSHWKALSRQGSLLLPEKLLVFGGETLQPEVLESIRLSGSGCRVVNHYGPTETTIGKLLHEVNEERRYDKAIPVGRPFSNTRVYVLSKELQLCPVGIPGQLYIGGDGLARGYWNNEEMTRQKFIGDPFVKDQAKMYGSGDLVRWQSDGDIAFIGRVDDQVKIRGYRVEPSEVRGVLYKSGLVREAVVVAGEDKKGAQRLVAYIVPVEEYDREELLRYLKEQLADYMVPAVMMEMEGLPLTANGKVDRKSLPDPEEEGPSGEQYVAPRDETEAKMAGIWQEVLEVDQVSMDADFFELGGHSLLAVRLVSAIRKAFAVEMPIGDIFDYPTVALLSKQVTKPTQAVMLPTIKAVNPRPARIPLSFSQERLWFIDQLDGSLQYHIPSVLRLKGSLDKKALSDSFQHIVNRHEVLRTIIREEQGTGYQFIREKDSWQLQHVDGSTYRHDAEGLEHYIKQFTDRRFDLAADYMVRATLISLEEDVHILVVTLHHIVSDGYSTSIMISELMELYNARYEKRAPSQAPLPIQYADYAIWQRGYLQGATLEHKLAFWKNNLQGVGPLQLPTDYVRPVKQLIEGASDHFHIGTELTERLQHLSRLQGTSLFMTLLTAFKVLLFRYSGQLDICVGVPVAGRQLQELEGLIGFFINTLALRSEITDAVSFHELLQRVRENTLLAFEHQDVPFEKVVEAVVKKRDMSISPLFQVMFMMQNTPPVAPLHLHEIAILPEVVKNDYTKFELIFSIAESTDGMIGTIQYRSDLYRARTIKGMTAHFLKLLDSIIEKPFQKIGTLDMLGREEKHRLLVDFNGINAALPRTLNVIELFEEQVAKNPDKIAIVFETDGISYRQLDNRSSQLAAYLTSNGVKKEKLIPIFIERSIEMIIGILGILKAGAAYVPLDPEYPQAGIGYLLEDIGADLVLTSKKSKMHLPLTENVRCIELDADRPYLNMETSDKLQTVIELHQLAYVIYTSGSTGKPKGVLIEHGSLLNYLLNNCTKYIAGEKNNAGSFIHLSYTFDASITGIFLPLLAGKTIVLASTKSVNVFEDGNLMKYAPYDFIKITPSHLDLLEHTIKKGETWITSTLVIGGEALHFSQLNSFISNGVDVEIINEYGPTESTVGCSVYSFHTQTNGDRSGSRIPIGKPVDNVQLYILDKAQELVPVGIPGELYIAGAGLARGYLNRPVLTAEKFIDNPFTKSKGSRIYKTGDFCRWLPDGNIEYIGRMDDQVKIRGHRVELGEIETVLQQSALTSQSVVLAKENRWGIKQLIGYIVPGEEEFTKEAITSYLRSRLPEYMVPQFWMKLQHVPLTSNGKVNKKLLPDIDPNEFAIIDYEAPHTKAQTELAAIWHELLDVQRVGINDNFFELGGHSILAMRVISVIRRVFQKEIAIRTLFLYPTIKELAGQLENEREDSSFPAITVQKRPERIPLSFGQERLWFIDQLEGTAPYHLPAVLRLKGNLNIAAMKSAWQRIVNRHEVLRTVILEDQGQLYQFIKEEDCWQLHYTEDGSAYRENSALLKNHIRQLIQAPFNLSKDDQLRVHLISLDREDHLLVVTLHHIAADGWSVSILVKEFLAFYKAHIENRKARLKPLVIQYADYAIWQRSYMQGEILNRKLAFWKNKLHGVSTLELPTDYPRPIVQSTNGSVGSFNIESDIFEQLKLIGLQEGATMFMILFASLNVLLHRYSGQQDICVGTPIGGRQQQEVEELIGFFINTLALRTAVKPDVSFRQFLTAIKSTALEAFEHQEAPFEKVVEVAATERDMSRSPLFQVMFVLQNTPGAPEMTLPELGVSVENLEAAVSKFDISFYMTETPGALYGSVQYCTDLFKESTIVRIIGHFKQLLSSIVKTPNQKIGLLPMLAEAERYQLLKAFNATKTACLNEKTLVDLFEDQVEKTPDIAAVVFEEKQLNYEELNAKANQLAHYLHSLDIKEESLVAICMERSLEMVIGIMGVLKAGAAFVPIDPDYPAERIHYMMEDTGASIVVSNSRSRSKIKISDNLKVIALDDESLNLSRQPEFNRSDKVSVNQLAYVIYTSGSTGQPKGVMVEHRSLVNVLTSIAGTVQFQSGAAFLSVTTFSFDIAYLELCLPLISGGRSIIISKDVAADGFRLAEKIKAHKPTHMQATPSTWQLLLDSDWQNSEGLTMLIGGEAVKEDIKEALTKKGAVYNCYGPTETTIWSVIKKLASNEKVVIGKPVSNTTVVILNGDTQLCPIGVVGEICIGGLGLARGYFNRAELTKEKFIDDPYNEEQGARLYRTGDLGRWLEDGNIECFGRLDNQVKVRGFRIELGEIETAIEQCKPVVRALVLAREDKSGNKRLVGYVVTDAPFDRQEMIDRLKDKLPEYMVPMIWVELNKLPLTSNGKVDRKALPEVNENDLQIDEYVAPVSELEKRLAAIWQKLLQTDRIGLHDNFFKLGGHSLLAMRLISVIRKELAVELSIKDLFLHATISLLAHHLKQQNDRLLLPPIEKADPRPDRIILSFSQERLWFIDQFSGTVQYHLPSVLRLKGLLDKEALLHALLQVINRHEVLRTVYLEQDGKSYQRVQEPDRWQLQTVDGSAYKEDNEGLLQYVKQFIDLRFNLSKDYMLRARLISLEENEHVLVIILHHIAADGWSVNILVKEVIELYESYLLGREAKLEPLPVQYADYAVWQRSYLKGEILDTKIQYWKNKLEGVTVLQLPTDYPRPLVQSTNGALTGFSIDKRLSDGLQSLSEQHGNTLFTTMLAALNVLLHRYSGQQDICVGTPAAGRQQRELEGLIGLFVNTLALRNEVKSSDSFEDLLQQVIHTTLEAQEYQEVPFEKVVEAVVKQRDLSHSPLFQVMLILRNTPEAGQLYSGELQLSPEMAGSSLHTTSKFDLTFNINKATDGIHISIEYCTDLYKSSTIETMAAHFTELLHSIVADAQQSIGSLPMLSSREKQQLLVDFNDTGVTYPTEKTWMDLFEEQVIKTPESIAVVVEDQQMSYNELNERSNRLAHYLTGNGLRNETLVVIYMERSAEMLIAMLGILKAGGAYVPVDPAYPADRVNFILEDTAASLVISSRKSSASLRVIVATAIIETDGADKEAINQQPVSNLHIPVKLSQLAYVIYTSGSTGRPKGVMIEHKNLFYFICWCRQEFSSSRFDIVYATTSICFDLSIFELLYPLSIGKSIRMLNNGLQIGQYLDTDHCVLVNSVPAVIGNLLKEGVGMSRISVLNMAGEPITHEVQQGLDRERTEIRNLYGPTEDTTYSTVYRLKKNEPVTIGKPISNTKIYILNNVNGLVSVGVSGEICITGKGIARGYLNRPDLTAKQFVVDPFSDERGGSMYKTGDLGRWLQDGTIEYLGRIDNQVKIRGYRIELEEIENVVAQSGLVKGSAILARENSEGTKRLIGYLVPGEGYTNEAVTAYLRSRLPDYMVPHLWVELEQLPLTSNGKVNRNALPDINEDELSSSEYVAPRNKLEALMADTWQQLLGIERAGIHDNFFELGGDSILTIQIVSRIRRLGYQLEPRDIFQYQTIARLSIAIGERSLSAVTGEQGLLNGYSGLLPVQQWYLNKDQADLSHYNQAVLLRIDKSLSVDVLKQVIEQICLQHDALRFAYARAERHWEQKYGDSRGVVCMEDLTSASPESLSKLIQERGDRAQRQLDIERGDLIRVVMMQTPSSENHNRLLLVVHHLAIDGVSWRILLEDMELLLSSGKQEFQQRFGPKSSSYRQWYQALEQYGQSQALLSQKAYWKNTLQNYEPLPDDTSYTGKVTIADAGRIISRLKAEQTHLLLHEVPRVYHTEINDILLCALAVTLCEWKSRSKVLIGLEGHGREEIVKGVDISRTIGWFTSMYPVLLQITEGLTAGEQIKSVKEQLRQIPDKGLGFGVLKYIDRDTTLQTEEPVWDILFNYLGQFNSVVYESKWLSAATESPGASVSETAEITEKVVVNSVVQSGELVFNWSYSSLHYEATTINALAAAYTVKLEQLIAHCVTQYRLSGPVHTPSDYGLSAEITYSELDNFLEEPFNGKKRKDYLEGLYRLSGLQQGMLFHGLYNAQAGAYIEQFKCDLMHVNLDHLVISWRHVMQHHSVFRTGFYYNVFSIPVQCVYTHLNLPLEVLDYRDKSAEDQSVAIKEYEEADRSRGFDFNAAPLMRLTLLKLSEDRYHLLWTFHHVLLDGWSLQVVMEELLSLYESLTAGLALNKHQEDRYEDYIRYVEKNNREAEENFWKRYLQGIEQSTLLPFISTTTQRTKGTGSYRSLSLELDTEATEKIQAYAQKLRLTMGTVMQGVWSLLLHRYTGNKNVVFGMIVSGRPEVLAGVEKRVGLYINTLPMHSTMQEELTVAEWLSALQGRQVDSLPYQHTPLHVTQQWSGIQGDFFDTILIFENYPVSKVIRSRQWALGVENVQMLEQTNYPLSIEINNDRKIRIDFTYNADLLKQEYAEQIKNHFENVLEQLVASPDGLMGEIELLTETEKNRLLVEFNDTQTYYPTDKTIADLFEQQVAKQPAGIALLYEEQRLTYGELSRRSNQLAHYLRNKGVKEDTLVPIYIERSFDLIIAILGILKAGGAYVPIDPDYPEERIRFILQDTEASMILVSRKSRLNLQNVGDIDIINIDEQWKIIELQPKSSVESFVRPAHLAYVIYTSGSMGKPKGVMIEHASLLNYVQLFKDYFSVSSDDTVIQQSSPSFDILVEEIYPALISGASINIIKDGGKDILKLKSCIENGKATIITATPMIIDSLNKELQDIGKLRLAIIGGDVLYPSNIDNLLGKVTIVNGYGPSEVTVCATYNKIEEISEASLIGKPINNVGIYIMNKEDKLAPIGISGEICIGGSGLARGYLNNAELTDQKFISNPFLKGKTSRLYRSGDIGRWLPDGSIEYMGRMDDQVKVRGYRIEPGEIESILQQCELVEQCVVLAREYSQGNKLLVGYIVPHGSFDKDGMIDYLKLRLPGHMVPALWVALKSVPLTHNGKIDWKALPDPVAMELSVDKFVAPRNELEVKLAGIWKEILPVEQVGIRDSFFDLGGHSLLIMRLMSSLRRELQIDLPIKTIFELNTIEELANYIKLNQNNHQERLEEYDTIKL